MPTEYWITYKGIDGQLKQHPHAESKTDLFVIMRGLLKDGARNINIEIVPPITGLKGVINTIDKALNVWENEQMGKIELIAIRSDNRHVLYSVKSSCGKAILEAEIKEFNGNRYYEHKGIKHQLPKEFNGKKAKLR